MKTTDTPETDNHESERDAMQTRASSDYFSTLELCRKLERECNELRDAIRNLRDVEGRHHSQIACERLFALLPENVEAMRGDDDSQPNQKASSPSREPDC